MDWIFILQTAFIERNSSYKEALKTTTHRPLRHAVDDLLHKIFVVELGLQVFQPVMVGMNRKYVWIGLRLVHRKRPTPAPGKGSYKSAPPSGGRASIGEGGGGGGSRGKAGRRGRDGRVRPSQRGPRLGGTVGGVRACVGTTWQAQPKMR